MASFLLHRYTARSSATKGSLAQSWVALTPIVLPANIKAQRWVALTPRVPPANIKDGQRSCCGKAGMHIALRPLWQTLRGIISKTKHFHADVL